VYVRENLDHRALTDTTFDSKPGAPGILKTRAWVYQERMLAPRFLHFLERELLLECKTTMTCECGCISDIVTIGARKYEIAQALASGDAKKIAFEWRQMITTYGYLKLTFAKDKLPAMAGMAKLFQEARNAACNAGIWEDTPVVDLAWETHNPGGIRTDTRVEKVPTWSWASVFAPVFHDYDIFWENVPLCDILHIDRCGMMLNLNEDTSKPYKLTLEGYTIPATLVYKENGRFCDLQIHGVEEKQHLGNDVALGDPGPSFVANGETVYCMLLLKNDIQQKSLVLNLVDQEEGIYRRIGVMRNNIGTDLFTLVTKKTQVNIV
jgi:hypothetical protein